MNFKVFAMFAILPALENIIYIISVNQIQQFTVIILAWLLNFFYKCTFMNFIFQYFLSYFKEELPSAMKKINPVTGN